MEEEQRTQVAHRNFYPTSQITWYADSPDAGLPECVCSACGLVIEDHPVTQHRVVLGGVRLFDTTHNKEARFHPECFNQLIK